MAPDLLAQFIRWVMRDTKYLGLYSCTVQAPSAGDTVDVMPDDGAIAGTGLQSVPVLYGAPDIKSTFSPGVKMLLFFAGGDPRQPKAIGFGGSAITTSVGGGLMPFARVGDTVAITAATSPSGPVTGTGIIMGGSQKLTG